LNVSAESAGSVHILKLAINHLAVITLPGGIALDVKYVSQFQIVTVAGISVG